MVLTKAYVRYNRKIVINCALLAGFLIIRVNLACVCFCICKSFLKTDSNDVFKNWKIAVFWYEKSIKIVLPLKKFVMSKVLIDIQVSVKRALLKPLTIYPYSFSSNKHGISHLTQATQITKTKASAVFCGISY